VRERERVALKGVKIDVNEIFIVSLNELSGDKIGLNWYVRIADNLVKSSRLWGSLSGNLLTNGPNERIPFLNSVKKAIFVTVQIFDICQSLFHLKISLKKIKKFKFHVNFVKNG
jgi:hypothetical protein